MLYIVNIQKLNKNIILYGIFETHTESLIETTSDSVVKLINKYGFEAKNFSIANNQVVLKDWPQVIKPYSKKELVENNKYILLYKVDSYDFKLVGAIGRAIYIDEFNLRSFIDLGKVANCEYIDNEIRVYRSTDTMKVVTDPKFTRQIDSKYSEFIAKTAMLGLDISFSYTIEGKDVKLTSYNGKSPKVIIPNFITTIREGAFMSLDIQELQLNKGLKYIGSNAFCNNRLKSVEIPETVKFIGRDAFDYRIEDEKYLKIYTKLNPNTLAI